MELRSHPAAVLAAVWLAMLTVDRARRHLGWSRPDLARAFMLLTGVGLLVAYGSIVFWYASQVSYFDPAEPTIAAVTSVFGAGQPLYPALDAAERYVHIYGPVLFLVHSAAFAVLGPGIVVSKAVGASAILISLVVGYRIFRDTAGTFAALIATSACVLVYMGFSNATFWARADPLLILCVVVGLLASRLRRPSAAFALLGVAMGLAVNLKVTGFLYLLPALATMVFARGPRALAGTVAVALLVAFAPFLLPNVSLAHYWDYLQLSARAGLVRARILEDLEWAIFLFAPLAGTLWSVKRSAVPRGSAPTLAVVLALALVLVAVVAAKPGGGPLHLLPFVPVLALAVLSAPGGERPSLASLAAFCLTGLLIAIPRQITFVETAAGRNLAPAVADLGHFADAHPGSRIAVGYAGTSYLSYARPAIVFRTHEYLLDAPAIQEHRLAGLALPAATTRVIEECRIDFWLIPPGAGPFAVPSAYFPKGPPDVFPEEFRAAFLRRYERTGRTDQFDVWECRRGTLR